MLGAQTDTQYADERHALLECSAPPVLRLTQGAQPLRAVQDWLPWLAKHCWQLGWGSLLSEGVPLVSISVCRRTAFVAGVFSFDSVAAAVWAAVQRAQFRREFLWQSDMVPLARFIVECLKAFAAVQQ